MITVNVTRKDINEGTRGSIKSCPVAIALRRKQRKKVSVVSWHDIKIGKNYYRSLLKDKEKMIDFLHRFDYDMNPSPTTFCIERE